MRLLILTFLVFLFTLWAVLGCTFRYEMYDADLLVSKKGVKVIRYGKPQQLPVDTMLKIKLVYRARKHI